MMSFVAAIAFLMPLQAEPPVRMEIKSKGNCLHTPIACIEVIAEHPTPWILRFITYDQLKIPPKLIHVSNERTLMVHGGVLRLLDTKNGIFIRRWIFPDPIEDVATEAEGFRVQTSRLSDADPLPQSTLITEDSPPPPIWTDNSVLMHRVAIMEGSWLDFATGIEFKVRRQPPLGVEPRVALSPEENEKLIAEATEAARRDPLSPLRNIALALLIKDAGRIEESNELFRRTIDRPTNFFSELFWAASALEDIGAKEWSALAFDRGYRQFWNAGLDSRLLAFLLPRLITLYLPYKLRLPISDDERHPLIERIYRLAPYVEGTPTTWAAMAEYFRGRGNHGAAALWQTRAEEAEKRSFHVWPDKYLRPIWYLLMAVCAASFIYVLVLHYRYSLQRRLMRSTAKGNWFQRRFAPSIAFWDPQDRRIVYLIVVLLWLSAGVSAAISEFTERLFSMPLPSGSGTLRAPVTLKFLQDDVDASADRDLLLALSLLQSGRLPEAERLYRTLSHSAEAWNNLGVIQSILGRSQEAEESFRNAARIDPTLTEAAFNMGQPVTDYWAGIHREYRPGAKMLAMPTNDVVYRAIRGRLSSVVLTVLSGPAAFWLIEDFLPDDEYEFGPAHIMRWVFVVGVALATCLAIALRFSRYREVTQPPPRWHWILEVLVPGTARGWRGWGILIVTICVFCFLQITHPFISFPSSALSRISFGLPPEESFQWEWPEDPLWLN
ncbi:MAG: tetratricopeptide repeat protein, partial [Acidobacteria bacterium]|nr:tetratricopeptide repeat protein [Acidobacteriota bacterium]